jgi:hypothetical protein
MPMTIPRRPLKFLPPHHALSHDVCFYLHDTLVSYLHAAIEEKLFDVNVPSLAVEEVAQMRGLTGEALADWLAANRPSVSAELIRRQSCIALASDAVNFLFEALSCSEKGKLTVTFALLRKPLKENLFLLELLLGNPERFTEAVANPQSDERTLSRLAAGEGGRAIVRDSLRALVSEGTFNLEWFYDVRFNKSAAHSLEQLWNKATHLVTSHRTYSTERDNFNFVFSDSEAHASQWQALYEVLPLLLNYFIDVVLALLSRFSNGKFEERGGVALQRTVAVALWISQPGTPWTTTEMVPPSAMKFSDLALPCPACEEPTLADRPAAMRFYERGEIECGECGLRSTLVEGEFEFQMP